MSYDLEHNITSKDQLHRQGPAQSLFGGTMQNPQRQQKTSYKLEYTDYATSALVADGYGYQQPHAPHTIIETPNGVEPTGPGDPRIKKDSLFYDANGNRTAIKQIIGEKQTALRTNLWDEEDRLKAVDLNPDATKNHPVAIYTYDADGQRIVKYNFDRIDVFSNARKISQKAQGDLMMYPSGLISAKINNNKKEKRDQVLKYTKHYYAGSQRVASRIGSAIYLGLFPYNGHLASIFPYLDENLVRAPSNATVEQAGTSLQGVFTKFGITQAIPTPIVEGKGNFYIDYPGDIFYFHPDHLGSSNYITNLNGNISQHMEYLPFGETLVEEHLNSNNSPYKFNGKELDEETGNYYYGARYYDPKFSIWLSVDPLAGKYPGWSPYSYTLQNPIKYIDPDGRDIILAKKVNGKRIYLKYRYNIKTKKGQFYNIKTGKAANTKIKSFIRIKNALDNLYSKSYGADLVYYLERSSKNFYIHSVVKNNPLVDRTVGKHTFVDPGLIVNAYTTKGISPVPFYIVLGHELGHIYLNSIGKSNNNIWYRTSGGKPVYNSEKNASAIENIIRKEHNLNLRKYYDNSINPLKKSLLFHQPNSNINFEFFKAPIIPNPRKDQVQKIYKSPRYF